MANIVLQRVQRDLKELQRNDDGSLAGITVECVNDNFQHLKGQIAGPPDTPYAGGKYFLDVKIPDSYPFNPPQIKFLTKIWHPNISSVTGFICLDILKDQWAASMTLRTIFLSLQALLCAPEPDDPQDAVVAKQYRENRALFSLTAQHWAQIYAGAGGSVNEEFKKKIQKLMEMGVSEMDARTALSSHRWELNAATENFFK